MANKVWWAAAVLAARVLAQTAEPAAGKPPVSYVLGADDTISIRAVDADEISDKSIRIGTNGFIDLPMVGRVHAAGLTVDGLEKELAEKLKPFIRKPEVLVNVVEMKSQPVSVIGEVLTPGIQQLQGRKTLVEVLSMAGGIRPDAGYSLKITRQKEWGPIPLANATVDSTGQFSVAEVSLRSIMEAKNPAENIQVMPNDVISVPRGQMVYVLGEVKRAGGFVLGEQPQMSVLQALAMASGLEKTASPGKAKILRAGADMKRTEVPVNLSKIVQGKDADVPMQPEDILVVPGSKGKAAAIRAAEMAAQIGTGLAIYRSY